MRWRVAGLLFTVLLQPAVAAQRFVELGAGRGLTASVVNAMLIDRDGLLWVGAREGLFRYDGYEAAAILTDLTDPGGASDLEVRALYEADDGALWVGTFGGGLIRRDPLTGRLRQYEHDPADPRSLSDPNVLDVAQDREGNLWGTRTASTASTPTSRALLTTTMCPSRCRSRAPPCLTVAAQFRGATVDRDPRRGGGSLGRGTPQFETYSLAQLTGGAPGLDLVFAHRGGARRSAVGRHPRGPAAARPTAPRGAARELRAAPGSEPFVAALHVDRLGKLWIGTLTHGLMVADAACRQRAGRRNGIRGRQLTCAAGAEPR